MKDRKQEAKEKASQVTRKEIEEVRTMIGEEQGELFLAWFNAQSIPIQIKIVEELINENTEKLIEILTGSGEII